MSSAVPDAIVVVAPLRLALRAHGPYRSKRSVPQHVESVVLDSQLYERFEHGQCIANFALALRVAGAHAASTSLREVIETTGREPAPL